MWQGLADIGLQVTGPQWLDSCMDRIADSNTQVLQVSLNSHQSNKPILIKIGKTLSEQTNLCAKHKCFTHKQLYVLLMPDAVF